MKRNVFTLETFLFQVVKRNAPPTSVCVLLFNMRNRVAHKLASGCRSVSPALVKSEEGVAPNYFHFFLVTLSLGEEKPSPQYSLSRQRG